MLAQRPAPTTPTPSRRAVMVAVLSCLRPPDFLMAPAAGGMVRLARLEQLGLPGPAPVDGQRAARREPAAFRHVDQAGRRAGDAAQLALRILLAGLRQRVEQGLGI